MTRLRHPASNILLVLSILLWGIEKARSFQHPNAKLFCSTRANTNFVRSPLFSFSPIENQDRKGEPPLLRKRDVARARLAQLVTKLLTFQTVVSENARNFLKKQQVKAASTFLINALILSIFFKDAFVSSYNPHKNNVPTTTVVEKPMQVPYSKFMDWCEGNKNRGSFFNPKPLVYLDNVHVESSGKIGYCLLTAETRAQKQALQEYIQNSKNGVPESVSQAKAVTHIVNTNSDLIQFLRENKVEFQAKEGKISNSDRIELLPTVVIGKAKKWIGTTSFGAYTAFSNTLYKKLVLPIIFTKTVVGLYRRHRPRGFFALPNERMAKCQPLLKMSKASMTPNEMSWSSLIHYEIHQNFVSLEPGHHKDYCWKGLPERERQL